jgi:NADH-quinone oxidoreductase subunit J
MSQVVFWITIIVTIASAISVVRSKNLVYAALSLLVTFAGVTALYIFLWADFLAGVQVVIYIGGIIVLILFGIMLTHRITSVNITQTNVQRGIGMIVALFILGFLFWMIVSTPWLQQTAAEPTETVRDIGILLMTDYLLPFEVASVLLLAALIGAAMLSRKSE